MDFLKNNGFHISKETPNDLSPCNSQVENKNKFLNDYSIKNNDELKPIDKSIQYFSCEKENRNSNKNSIENINKNNCHHISYKEIENENHLNNGLNFDFLSNNINDFNYYKNIMNNKDIILMNNNNNFVDKTYKEECMNSNMHSFRKYNDFNYEVRIKKT